MFYSRILVSKWDKVVRGGWEGEVLCCLVLILGIGVRVKVKD
jgi:hypothetical protein